MVGRVLVVFVIAAKITGNGSLAWSIAEYTSLSVCGIVLLLVLVSGLRDAKEKRRGPSATSDELP